MDFALWEYNEIGTIGDGKSGDTEGPQCMDGVSCAWGFSENPEEPPPPWAFFKHSQDIQTSDVFRMHVRQGLGCEIRAYVGFAGEGFDVHKHGETGQNTAHVLLADGTSMIGADISRDGEQHYGLLRPRIPEAPFDLALRCEAVTVCGTTLLRNRPL